MKYLSNINDENIIIYKPEETKYIVTILFFISTSIAQSLTVDECVRIALENKR